MEAYKAETVGKQSGTLVLEHLPFQAGDYVEVIVMHVSTLPQQFVVEDYPLRGTVLRYDDPFAPVAESEWEALQ